MKDNEGCIQKPSKPEGPKATTCTNATEARPPKKTAAPKTEKRSTETLHLGQPIQSQDCIETVFPRSFIGEPGLIAIEHRRHETPKTTIGNCSTDIRSQN